jgi:hypothetical protein
VERRVFDSCLPGYQKGYSEETIGMTVPTVPDLMKDFCASNEQTDVCKRRLDFAMAGASSMTGAVIKSWSTEQRGYHARDRARLRKFPMIFSGERIK